MAKVMRWAGYLVGALLILLLIAIAYIWIASSMKLNARAEAKPARLATPTAAQLADGPRQLHVLGCHTCHGDGLQGEVFLDEPGVATVYAPNLTLVAAKATDAQLDQAIRQGIGHDGRPLLIMPSEGYQFLTDAEAAALIAAIRATPKTGKEQPTAKVGPKGRIGIDPCGHRRGGDCDQHRDDGRDGESRDDRDTVHRDVDRFREPREPRDRTRSPVRQEPT